MFDNTSVLKIIFVLVIVRPGAVAANDAPIAAVPNELGAVMILMYHDFGPREAKWMRTPNNFEKDLKTLYENGFRPVSLSDFVQNTISVPAGYSPVIITFDDGNLQQFEVTVENGGHRINPRSAVGVLTKFAETHEDFPLEATFFLNGKFPFRQPEFVEFKLNFLIEHGMDIGNHTVGHRNLSLERNQQHDIIQKTIGKQAQRLQSYIRDDAYRVNTLALCFGQRPRRVSLQHFLRKGSFKGEPYENIAVLNVGSGPSPSPMDKSFDPMRLPRIRASERDTKGFGLYDWLKYFDENPEQRFISDGDPNTITVRKKGSGKVARDRLRGKSIIILDD